MVKLYTRTELSQNIDMILKYTGLLITLLALLSVSTFSQNNSEPKKSNTRPETEAAKEPFDAATVEAMAKQCVSLDTESGLIIIEMFPESAPESVRNFLNLAATGLLDTTTFSRVVPNFVIQGGDLYSREDKITRAIGLRARKVVPDEPNKILHERGIVSMARGDEPNTATTNFFILVDSASYLDGKFAAFGRVTKGMDVVDAINKADVVEEKPAKPVCIKKATVATCG
jgi:peptidyl-prolyl cis-trans isomerase B (cyclophilin B)